MAIIVYKTNHKIPLKFGDAIIKVSPLNEHQRAEIEESLVKSEGTLQENLLKKTRKLFKYSIKEVEGFELATGQKYKLEFDDKKKDALTDACVNDFFSMQIKADLATILWSFLEKISRNPMDANGEPIKGVEVLPAEGGAEIKK